MFISISLILLLKIYSKEPIKSLLKNDMLSIEPQKNDFDVLLQNYVNVVESTIFPEIKKMIFDISYDHLKKTTNTFKEHIKKIAAYDVADWTGFYYCSDKEIQEFSSNVINVLDTWNDKNCFLLKNIFYKKMQIYYYNLIAKEIFKSQELDIKNLTHIYASLLEDILKESVKNTAALLVDDLINCFKKINISLNIPKRNSIAINETERLKSIKNLSNLYKKIFHDLFFELNQKFYLENHFLIEKVSHDQLLIDMKK